MKKILVLAAAAFLMAGCGNKQKENGQAAEKAANEGAATEQVAEGDCCDDDAEESGPTGIPFIRSNWADGFEYGGGRLRVELTDIKDNVNRFAAAFCRAYPYTQTNKQLRNYFLEPDEFDKELFRVESKPRDGYVRCLMATETESQTQVCYWNRKNGHKLIAVYMEDNHENDAESDRLVVFYDYDPDTDLLTPVPSLNSMIEERVKGYDKYSVWLPQTGKNIEVLGYAIDRENDFADVETLTLIWDGMTFNWETTDNPLSDYAE